MRSGLKNDAGRSWIGSFVLELCVCKLANGSCRARWRETLERPAARRGTSDKAPSVKTRPNIDATARSSPEPLLSAKSPSSASETLISALHEARPSHCARYMTTWILLVWAYEGKRSGGSLYDCDGMRPHIWIFLKSFPDSAPQHLYHSFFCGSGGNIRGQSNLTC